MSNRSVIQSLLGGDRGVWTHRAFIKLLHSFVDAGFLEQCIHYSTIKEAEGGWFYKSTVEWTEEMEISRREQENARDKLTKLGVLQIRRSTEGLNRALFFRVDFLALEHLLIDGMDPDKPGSPLPARGGTGRTDAASDMTHGTSDMTHGTSDMAATNTTPETTPETSSKTLSTVNTPNNRSPREGRPPSARTSATPRTGGDRGPEKVATRATTASGSPATPGSANPTVSQQPAKQPGGVPSDEALLLVRWWQEQTQKPVEETYRQQHVDAAELLIEKAGCADEARSFIAWRVSQGWSTDLRYMPAKYIPGWRDMLLGIPKHGKPRGGGLTLDRDGFRPGDTPEMLQRYADAF